MRFSFVLFFLSIYFHLFAQLTIEGKDINPSIGDTFLLHYTEYIDPGFNAQNLVWDYSNLKSDSTYIIRYKEPTVDYPLTNFTIETTINEGYSHRYVNINDDNWEYFGIDAPLTGNSYYIDNAIKLKFLISLESFFDDSFETDTFYIGSLPLKTSGFIQITTDSSATLITPEGTFEDVIRLRVIEFSETKLLSPFNNEVKAFYISSTYFWYKKGVKNFIMMTKSSDYNGETKFETAYLGFPKPIENFIIYPNPAKDYFTINLNSELAEISMIDINGRFIDLEFEHQKNKIHVSIHNIQSGTYFVKIVDQNQNILFKKVVIN